MGQTASRDVRHGCGRTWPCPDIQGEGEGEGSAKTKVDGTERASGRGGVEEDMIAVNYSMDRIALQDKDVITHE